MTEDIDKCVLSNNVIFLKEEYEDNEYLEDKVQTSIDLNNINDPFASECDVKDHSINESKPPANTDMELTVIKDENTIANTKTEIDNRCLFCSYCHADNQDYCTSCRMLVSILDGNSFNNINNSIIWGIPMSILAIREFLGYVGIFALKVIPEGVHFGPVTGLDLYEWSWRIKRGKLVATSGDAKCFNWMWYINPTRSIAEQNLHAFQCDGHLYYRTINQIQVDTELLVYFDEEHENSLCENVERKLISLTEENVKDVYACTFCCLGFSSKLYLQTHKTHCPNNTYEEPLINDLIQCSYCKIYLVQKEHQEYHENYCREKHLRECMLPKPPASDTQMIELKNPKGKKQRQKYEIYKCLHCKYKTAYKSDLISHANTHYPVKICSCNICHRRFKRQDTLKAHLMNAHDYIEGKQIELFSFASQYNCTKCEYKTHISSRLKTHLYTHEKIKRFKCSHCEYGTNYKCHLKKHVNAIHCQVKKYKCTKCDFTSFYQSNLSQHLYIHEKAKQFQCSECEFETNYKAHLERHIIAIHREVKKYKCTKCDFETSYDSNLRSHLYTHEQVKRLKCSDCDYETHRKRNLRAHINSKHSEVKTYKCLKCKFETAHDSSFKKHLYTHEERKGLNCAECDYETNNKRNLKLHMDTKHCKGKKYKCTKCDYESVYDASFRKHLYTHEEVKRLTCTDCDFKTNYKWHLKKHMNARHLKLDI